MDSYKRSIRKKKKGKRKKGSWTIQNYLEQEINIQTCKNKETNLLHTKTENGKNKTCLRHIYSTWQWNRYKWKICSFKHVANVANIYKVKYRQHNTKHFNQEGLYNGVLWSKLWLLWSLFKKDDYRIKIHSLYMSLFCKQVLKSV